MKTGDLIRLKFPFAPDPNDATCYQFAVVVEVVSGNDGSTIGNTSDNEASELLVYLCDGDRFNPYVDEFGDRPLYSFSPDEVDTIIHHPSL